MLVEADTGAEQAPTEEFVTIQAKRIRPNPEQPRQTFVDREVQELSESIREKGQETPIRIARWPGDADRPFILIDGEKRWRSCMRLRESFGMKCVIEQITDPLDLYLKSLRANTHRSAPPPNDMAASVLKLQEAGLSIEDNAKEHAVSVATIRNYLSLKTLDSRVLALLDPNIPEERRLNVTVAFELAPIPIKDVQFQIAEEVIAERMTTPQARVHIGEVIRKKNINVSKGRATSGARDLHRQLNTFFGMTSGKLKNLLSYNWALHLSYKGEEDENKERAIAGLRAIEAHARRAREYLEQHF